jgi:hypothetical protein
MLRNLQCDKTILIVDFTRITINKITILSIIVKHTIPINCRINRT